MPDEISLYQAKAKLSALVRQVREGRSIIITPHGEPAAELRPIDRAARRPSLLERLAQLELRGGLERASRAPSDPEGYPKGPRKRGALMRFLSERD